MKIKDTSLIAVIMVVGLLFFMAVRSHYYSKDLEKNGRYIYCQTLEKNHVHNRFVVDISYYYRGKNYMTSRTYYMGIKIQERYYMKVSTKKTSVCIVYFDKPVPDTIRGYPDDGWSEIPRRVGKH